MILAEKPIIEVQGLTKRFKVLTAVNNVSFSVEKGSITGMIGPNGAGKSTTFNMICGCYPPTEGKIFYNGEDISNKKAYEYTNMKIARTSAESYTVVWLFKAAIEKAGSADGAAVRDALASLSIDGSFPGGRKIVLPYAKIEFAPEYELGGVKHYRDNTYASVAIAQVQGQEWKTVWPFEFASSKIQDVTLG